MARKFRATVSKLLVFWRGDYCTRFQIDQPDGDEDVLLKIGHRDSDEQFIFMQRAHARQLARELLEAADA